MFSPLPTPQEMAHWDRLCIQDFGLAGMVLMENASREALYALKKRIGNLRGKSAIIFAGSGNNGGDAFALARHIVNHEGKVMVLHTKHKKDYTGDTAVQLELAQKLDIPCVYLPEYNMDFLPPIDIIIDGLLGTGFQDNLSEQYRKWIKNINKLGRNAFVLALDIPSGINGTTGEPLPIAVKADTTVTFEEAKLGLFLPPAKEYVGELIIGKIGIPRKLKQDHPCEHVSINKRILHKIKTPSPTMHKGQAGHLLIIGGSPGLTGAPFLAALAALRSGVGLTTIACPSGLAHEVKNNYPDVMTLPLGQGINWDAYCMQELDPYLQRFSTVVIGPGLGRAEATGNFLQAYMENPHPSTIYDADALNFLAQDPSLIKFLDKNTIYTPHPGEMARFFDTSPTEINRDRAGYAKKFCESFPGTLILKGAATIIFSPDQPLSISPFATASLAIGGSGDVLAGLIGSLRAQGLDALDAAQIGVFWHGLTGQCLQTKLPFRGSLAQEIAHQLPIVLKEWKNANS